MMQLSCSKRELSYILNFAARAVKPRSPLPVLQCVRFTSTSDDQRIRLYATDYEMAIETSMPARVEDGFDVALGAKQFNEIVQAMPGDELKIKLTDAGNVTFQSHHSTMRMSGMTPEDMVTLPPVDDPIGLILPEWMLRKIIDKVVFAASQSETNIRFCGSCFTTRDNYLEMAATDTHVLSVYRQIFDGDMGRDLSVIIPRQTQLDLLKLLKEKGERDVHIRVDTQQISFSMDAQFSMISRLIDGDFCNYSRLQPKNATVSVVVDREALLDAVKRLAIAAREDSHRVYCEYAGPVLRMKAKSADGGCEAEEEVQIALEGGPMTNVLHAQQALSVLSAFDCEEIHLGIEAPLAPVSLRPTDSTEHFAVLMPLSPA